MYASGQLIEFCYKNFVLPMSGISITPQATPQDKGFLLNLRPSVPELNPAFTRPSRIEY